MTSYRAANEWEDRFGGERLANSASTPFGMEFQVESYLDAKAQKFVNSFEPNSYMYLSRAMDWFDVAQHGSGLTETIRSFNLDAAHIIGVTTDTLFPLHQQRTLARAFRDANQNVQFTVLDSVQGHDAFLVDFDGFAPVISDFLA